jgi:hypothetical protein
VAAGQPQNRGRQRQMAITDFENEQIEKANASGGMPVVFIHGL